MKIGSRALNVALQQLIMSYATHKQRTLQGGPCVDEHAPPAQAEMCSSELERVARELSSKSMQLEVLKNRCKELSSHNQTLADAARGSQATIACLAQQEADLLDKCGPSFWCLRTIAKSHLGLAARQYQNTTCLRVGWSHPLSIVWHPRGKLCHLVQL